MNIPVDFRELVYELDGHEKKVAELRHKIIQVLIENGLHGYFQVNWSKLKRDIISR